MDRPWHREDIASLLEGEAGGDERAARLACLHHQQAAGEPTDQTVPAREVPGDGWRAERTLGYQAGGSREAMGELPIRRGIYDVDPGAEDGHGRADRRKPAAMGG